jgi:hypothetical protein
LVALANVRISLVEGAHVAACCAAWQEIRVRFRMTGLPGVEKHLVRRAENTKR